MRSKRALDGLEQEIGYHIEQEIQENIDRGLSAREARRRALLKFGNVVLVTEDTRGVWRRGWLADVLRDYRLTVRGLWRSPLFTTVTVATLSLGIGATTAVYSFVDGVLLSPLSYPAPDRLVVVQEVVPAISDEIPVMPVNLRSVVAWQRECRTTCRELVAVSPSDVALTGAGTPEALQGARVSPGFFKLLGTEPLLGRTFRPDEDDLGRARVAVLTYGFWQRRYGGDPAVLGRTLTLDDEPVEIVGVLPSSFRFPRFDELSPTALWSGRPEFFEPFTYTAAAAQEVGNFNYLALLRLPPEVTLTQATAELDIITAEAFSDSPIHPYTRLLPMLDQVVGDARRPLWLLLAAVMAMLAVASVNVANMLGVRWLERRRDLAIRRAIGAPPHDAVLRAVRESLLLAVAGGLGGVVLAYAALQGLLAAAPVGVPRLDEVAIDRSVFAVSVGVTLVCGLLCGLVPAWRARRVDPIEAIKANVPAGRRPGASPSVLVGLEVALGVALVVVSGLLLSSFVEVMNVERGFDVDRILAVDVHLPQPRYGDADARVRLYTEVLRGVADAPGVLAAGMVQRLPLEGVSQIDTLARADDTRPLAERSIANYRMVSPDYARTMGIAITRGRMFTDVDRERRVIVVSEQTARTLWPGEEPVGRLVSRSNAGEDPYEVVGVVADARILELETDAGLVAYLPYWERPSFSFGTIVVRSEANPAVMLPVVTAAFERVDPTLPLQNIRSMQTVLENAVGDRRFQLAMTAGFALTGLLLVGLGVYGVVASTVERRRGELALHLALGATTQRVLAMVVGRGLQPVVLGLTIGLATAVVGGRLIASLLYEVAPHDWVVLTAATVVVLGVALTACLVPARRAVRTSPTLLLKAE